MINNNKINSNYNSNNNKTTYRDDWMDEDFDQLNNEISITSNNAKETTAGIPVEPKEEDLTRRNNKKKK